MTEHEIRRMVVRLIGDGSNYFKMLDAAERKTGSTKTTIQQYAKQIESAGDSLTKFGQKARRVGIVASAAITAPLTAGAAKTISAFSNFDQAMTETFAKMGRQAPNVRKAMEDQAKALSTGGQVAFNPTELAKGYEELASAGLNAERSMAALPITAKFAQAGVFDMGVAVKQLTGAMASFGITTQTSTPEKFASEMEHFSDVIVGVANETTTSVEAVARAMSADAAVAAKNYGMTLEELGGILGVYAMQNKDAEEAGNLTGRMLRLLTASSVEEAEAWQKMGVDISDADGNFIAIADAIEQVENAMQGLSGEQQIAMLDQLGFATLAQKSILPLIGQSKELRRQSELYKKHGTTTEMAAIQMESFANQQKVVWNQVHVVAIEIGKFLVPSIQMMNKRIQQAIGYWNSFSEVEKQQIVNILKVVAVLGPMLIGLGTLVVVLGTLISTGGVVIGWLGAITVPMWGIVAGVVALGVALGGALYWLIGSEGIIQAFKILGARVQNFVITAVAFMRNFQQNIGIITRWIGENWQSLIGDLGELWGLLIVTWVGNLLIGVETIVRIMTVLAGWMTALFQKLWTVDFVNAIIQGIIEGAKALGNFATRAASAIKDALMGRGVDMSGFFAQMEGDFKKGAEDLNPLDALGDVIKEQMGKVEANTAGITNFKLKTALPELALGAIGAVPLNPLAQESALGAVADPLKASLAPGSEKMQALDNLKDAAVAKTNETLDTIAEGIAKLVENSNKGLRNPTLDVEAAGLTE